MPNEPEMLLSLLSRSEYPGRGIVIGADDDGVAFAAYWLTGRSRASRMRSFEISDNAIVVVDRSAGPHDDLRHYVAARLGPRHLLLGNGSHVDQLADQLDAGTPVECELNALHYEPDPPIRTPRISAYVRFPAETVEGVTVSGASAVPHRPEATRRQSLHVDALEPTEALMVATYAGGSDLPQTDGHPQFCRVSGPWTALAESIWETLNERLRVGVVVFPVRELASAVALPAASLSP